MNLDFKNATNTIISQETLEILRQYNSVIIFGAGDSGSWVFLLLKNNNIKIDAFCDNYKAKQGTIKEGLPVLSFEDAITKYPDSAICIGSVWFEEIYNQIINFDDRLKNNVFSILTTMVWETGNKAFVSDEVNYIQAHIQDLEKTLQMFADDFSKKTFEGLLNYRLTRNLKYLRQIKSSEKIYLDKDIVNQKLIKKDVLVDGGAFDGDTIQYFINEFGTNKLCIHAYEADLRNSMTLKKNIINKYGLNLMVHNAALWDKDGEILSFSGNGLSGSVNGNITSNEVKTETIDSLINLEKKVGYIKLDIEGAEKKALMGAKLIIQRDRPILAVCAYHLQDDLIELPKLVKQICPDYKLYLRHYRLSSSDTVLYAIKN